MTKKTQPTTANPIQNQQKLPAGPENVQQQVNHPKPQAQPKKVRQKTVPTNGNENQNNQPKLPARHLKVQQVLKEREIADWVPIFNELFSNSTDDWDFRLQMVTKKYPLRTKKKWERCLGEKYRMARFQCVECKHTWNSRRGWVRFWIWRDEPDAKGRRQGHVVAYVFGQKCEQCFKNNVNLNYEPGQLPKDEIEAVLSFLYMDIDYHFYGNGNYTHLDEQGIENGRKNYNYRRPPGSQKPHFSEGCQACKNKVCKVKIAKNYPAKVDPTEV